MKIYISAVRHDQYVYTESRYWTPALPHDEIVGVFRTKEQAESAAEQRYREAMKDFRDFYEGVEFPPAEPEIVITTWEMED